MFTYVPISGLDDKSIILLHSLPFSEREGHEWWLLSFWSSCHGWNFGIFFKFPHLICINHVGAWLTRTNYRLTLRTGSFPYISMRMPIVSSAVVDDMYQDLPHLGTLGIQEAFSFRTFAFESTAIHVCHAMRTELSFRPEVDLKYIKRVVRCLLMGSSRRQATTGQLRKPQLQVWLSINA